MIRTSPTRGLARTLVALAAPALLGACVTVRWSHIENQRPVPEERYAGLAPGYASLDDALAALGAPLLVRELPSNGVLCAWGWEDSRNLGLTLQVPVTSDIGLSFDYDDHQANLTGIVLLFDGDLRLSGIQRGKLASLIPQDTTPRLVLPEELLPPEEPEEVGEG